MGGLSFLKESKDGWCSRFERHNGNGFV